MDPFVLSQCIAALSFLLGILSFQFKDRRDVLYCWFFADAINAMHFYLLGRYEVMALLLVSASRFLTAAYTRDRRAMYFFFALTVFAFSFTYEHPVSILVLISGFLGIYGTFHRADLSIRYALLGCGTLWITHNAIVGSPVAVVMESAYLVSNLIGLWRFYRHKPRKLRRGRVV